MTDSKDILKSLLETMEISVRTKTDELTQFRQSMSKFLQEAEEFISCREAEIVRDLDRIKLFQAEMDEMSKEAAKSQPPAFPDATEFSVSSDGLSESGSQSRRIREAARAILLRAKRPMHQAEIHQAMVGMGVVVNSSRPAELIRAALRRDDAEFQHVKRLGWILAENEKEP